MAVTIKVPTIMRRHTEGLATVEATGATLEEILRDLERRYPGLGASVMTEDGELHRFVNVYVNSEDVRYLGAMGAGVKDGDVVAILPAVAGG